LTSLAARRLAAQRLTGEPFESAVEAVRWLGAVQSQDYGGAKWGVAQRTLGATDSELDRLFDQGAILRTHVLRPTWHFVVPEDLDRLLQLTGPRILRGLAGRHRSLELDLATVARAAAAFEAALAGGEALTRAELSSVLVAAGIRPDGQRLPHLLLCAELDGLVTSGPRRGKQFTWMLLEARAPRAETFDRAEAAGDLVRRYFRSHGPAQLQDFTWWSGLTAAESRAGIELAAADLASEEIEGKRYWSAAGAEGAPEPDRGAHLLPNFDEYLVAYRDRSAALHADHPAGFTPPFGGILSNVVLVAGRVRGTWRKSLSRSGVEIEVSLPDDLTPAERRAADEAAKSARRFFDPRT
jgi:hypothetical protein